MVYLLRSPECYGYNKSGILKAISDSRIYKGYRWNFINKETMPTVEYKSSTPIRDAILQLNETKDSIIETFTTKDEAAKILGIGKLTMRNIIKNQEKHNNYYYIEYSKCPLNIIEKYDNPIFVSGTSSWTFGSWDGNISYTTETTIGPYGEPISALKLRVPVSTHK